MRSTSALYSCGTSFPWPPAPAPLSAEGDVRLPLRAEVRYFTRYYRELDKDTTMEVEMQCGHADERGEVLMMTDEELGWLMGLPEDG